MESDAPYGRSKEDYGAPTHSSKKVLRSRPLSKRHTLKSQPVDGGVRRSRGSKSISPGPWDVEYNRILKQIESHLPDAKGGTTNDQLEPLARKLLGERFIGVMPRSEFHDGLLTPGQFAIVNTGEHWVALIKLGKDRTLLYDSYGRRMRVGEGRLVYPEQDPEQSYSEYNCGQRSLAFIVLYVLHGLEAAMTI